ncbi:MAG: J domain-containing protein [Deltaproteobacteria bacterium]|nr:J domain-containing protein [Deltaproteobacteria bacterium]MBI3295566.1 J domain-containing protein [Deltaproteobacteria bacterium]
MNSHDYRQEAYRLRSHPHQGSDLSLERRDSFAGVYWSLLPFIGLEIFSEAALTTIPGGLVFPLGFFLFWAFYFTYSRPGHLEARLTECFQFSAIPTLVLGGVIWLIKVTVVELGETFLFRWWAPKKPVVIRVETQRPRPTQARPTPPPPPRPTTPVLPNEVRRALLILGLPETRDWTVIHKRYRELAKQYHPDLNPNLTATGTRFMVYDAAFRKLAAYKGRLFNSKAA